jgi:hypothetical protein
VSARAREGTRACEHALRCDEIVGLHGDDEGISVGLDVDREPAPVQGVGLDLARLLDAEDDARLVADERARKRLARQAGERAHVDARTSHARLASVGASRDIGVRRLDGIDDVGREELARVRGSDAAAPRLDLPRAIRGTARIGHEGRAPAGAREGDGQRCAPTPPRRCVLGFHEVTLALLAAVALAISTFASACRPAATAEERAADACAGVPEDAGSQGLFPYRDEIERVEPYKVEVSSKEPARLAGATLVLRAEPGLTAEWLERLLECHLARRVPCPDGESCPLEVGPLHVDARSAGPTFIVDVRARDPETAREALRRARALARPLR